ncbi:hypothetical protein J2Z31_001833 [Sinorhizobium kostiense]|uniref:Uncharacterized protein n=1 Tax=Sinorhizobium kostiense TaxID=76747 RepID=A0ABS4QXG2_9HYPH|nr:hypothetical protein [Sinorhizobium kostiense]MBP2235341.1 hypothetical protein [Sinorhizobium kostiense]
MLRAIARALAAAVSGLWKGALWSLNFAEQIIRWPFSVIFGSGGGDRPNPHFEPQTSGVQLLDEFEAARARQAAVHKLDRDGVDTVIKYARAKPSARPTIDLGGLRRDVRATLLTMDDNELQALANASIGAVREFLEVREHGIHGVPIVRPIPADTALTAEMTADERVLWKVRSKLLKSQQSSDFKLSM